MFACSPERKLQRLYEKNPHLAETKIEIKRDTIIRDSIRIFETSVLKTNYDTVVVVKPEYKYQIVRLPNDTFQVEVQIPADTIIDIDTVTIREFTVQDVLLKKEKKAIRKKARRWGFIFGCIVGALAVLAIWQRKKLLPLLMKIPLPF